MSIIAGLLCRSGALTVATTRVLRRAAPRIARCVEMRVVCVGSALCVYHEDTSGRGDMVKGAVDGGGGRGGVCW